MPSNNNVSPVRKFAKDFKKTPLTRRLGPVVSAKPPLEEAVADGNQEIEYNDWQVMDNFDEGLRSALIQFINTTKEGKILTTLTGSTRTKTINFQFYGNPSKDIIGAGDIGEFKLEFKYTKKIIQPLVVTQDNTIIER
tara:strand:+ start:4727 stop:5140 length:414 start_codon:yes stop_codon:yes gene_type:complete